MEEQPNNNHNHNQQPESPPRSPWPSAPSSSSVSSTQIEENDRTHHQEELEARSGTVAYRSNVWLFGFGLPSGTVIGDDTWSSFATAIPFWFLAASLLVIFGFYGSLDLQLSSNYSLLIQPNTFFVQTIKVKQVCQQNSGMLMLYGFRKPPPLDVEKAWTETHNVAVVFEHKEWLYYLNKGSKVDIFYSVKSPSSAALSLVIVQGRNGLIDWVDDPSDPNQTLSWNIMFGSGVIQQEIPESDFYYIAVGNFNSQQVEVQLNFTVNAVVYNTSNAYYSCSVSSHKCSLRLYFLSGNLAVLTTTGPTELNTSIFQSAFNDNWNVRISYEPRWIAYCAGSGVMTVLLLLSFRLCKASSQTTTLTDAFRIRAGDMGSARNPLLVHQDDDDLWCEASSSDSPSPDEEDLEGSSNKRICVICYDAPRDCFFLPCGHAASCYACATRIKEEHGLCPMCRKATKKVQRIFSV
ncbi:hypothetical protein LWI28_014372 [Acer negundo]|uniref:RING-type domain-containing protein n=1 Tax=Acer negundo TaxID=4023 RepID=A0AAD5P1S2_ACENE|nr:hypothetical protein LWI28_014372 [Acer negundo]KAK4855619.1 hypothetical protein QYF36_009091 [Acer negundo]